MDSQESIFSSRSNEARQHSILVLGPEEAATIALLASRIQEQRYPHCEEQVDTSDLVKLAYWIYQSRRQREYYFESRLFSEPAWDLLLAAYCLGTTKQCLTVSALCHSAGCPFTTALRWIQRLERFGLMERRKCDRDGRMIYSYLTPDGRHKIESYLRRLESRPTHTLVVKSISE